MRSTNRNRFFSFWHRFQQRFSRFLKVYLFFGRRRLCHCGTAGGHHRRGGRCRSLFFSLLPPPPALPHSSCCCRRRHCCRLLVFVSFFLLGGGTLSPFFFCRSLFGLSVAFCAFDGNAKKGKKKRHGKGEASRSDREPRKPVLLLLLLFLFFLVSSSPFGFFFSLVVARVRPRKREGGALNEKGGE